MPVFEEKGYKKAKEFKVMGKGILWDQGQRNSEAKRSLTA